MQITNTLNEQLEVTPHKLIVAVREIADNVMITDAKGIIEYVNPAFEKTTGYSQLEMVGQTPRLLSSGRHSNEFYSGLWQTINEGNPFHATVINKKKNGGIYYADQMISPIKDADGKVTHFVAVWHDITPHVLLEQQLIELNRDLNIQKRKMEEVLLIESGMQKHLNLHKIIDFAVEKAVAIVEAKACSFMQVDEVSGEICIKGHQGIDEAKIDEMSLHLGDGIGRLMAVHGQGPQGGVQAQEALVGQPYFSTQFLSVPIFTGSKLFGLINVSSKHKGEFNDLDLKVLHTIVRQLALAVENARLSRELRYWESKDALLNIYNYRHCCRLLDYEISRAKRYGGSLSVLLINIDSFREYNSAFGQAQGDKFLQNFGRMLDLTLREVDTVCRYVGDEFIVILPGTDEAESRFVANKIFGKVKEVSPNYPMSVSIGAAQLGEGMNRYDLMRKADGALLAAKKNGKGQFASPHIVNV